LNATEPEIADRSGLFARSACGRRNREPLHRDEQRGGAF